MDRHNGVYCVRMSEMKALVEPFPLVPAMCMGRMAFRSDGYERDTPSAFSPYYSLMVTAKLSYLITHFAQPFDHFGNGVLVH